MSHVATIEIEIKDLAALEAAAHDCGLVFKRNQKTYRWYGRSVGDYPIPAGFTAEELGTCEHAIGFESDKGRPIEVDGEIVDFTCPPYEIGVVPRRDGKPGYALLWDFFCGGFGLEAAVGVKAQKLVQRYAVQVAKRTAQKQGYACREAVKEDGTVQLELTRRAGY
jgi:hypothetical protein